MQRPGSRRQMLLGALATAALPGVARAQQALSADSLRQLLGSTPLRAILPQEAFQAAEFVSALMTLEAEAKVARLPPSRLSTGDAPLPASLDRLYELALPRLVALIDRAEVPSPPLAEKAGALLAQLHATQHQVPRWLGTLRLPVSGEGEPLALDPGSDEAESLDLPQPGDIPLPDLSGLGAAEPGPALSINRSHKFADLAQEYAAFFASATVREAHRASADWHLAMMRQSRPRYERVGQRSGVPWHVIAAIHGLEASFNFRAHYHNGDFPLSSRTRQVPANRPSVWLPPSDWEASAIDALRLLGFTGATDWSLARTLYRLEAYNGFGYRRIGRASPYLWSFSSHFERGKFVADGKFDPRARSQQCGAAVMLKLLADAGDIALT